MNFAAVKRGLRQVLQTERIDGQTRLVEGLGDEVGRRIPARWIEAGGLHSDRLATRRTMGGPADLGGPGRLRLTMRALTVLNRASEIAAQSHVAGRQVG